MITQIEIKDIVEKLILKDALASYISRQESAIEWLLKNHSDHPIIIDYNKELLETANNLITRLKKA